MKTKQFNELLLQSLEHERAGVRVYETALACVLNDDLREKFEQYLDETNNHVRILESVFTTLQLDPEQQTPGRAIVRNLGAALIKAMQDALTAGEPEAAQLVACECVVLAEIKDHLDWELLTECSAKLSGTQAKAVRAAADEVEDQEDEPLYHSKGWCRELWMKWLGMRAVLPPPEERKPVKTAIGAARAEQSRDSMQ